VFDREITRWYIFNIADACVSTGIVLLLLFNYKIPSYTGSPEETFQETASTSRQVENSSATEPDTEKNDHSESEKPA
jgi:hypothetical protein